MSTSNKLQEVVDLFKGQPSLALCGGYPNKQTRDYRFTVLVGSSCVGKSTLLNLLLGNPKRFTTVRKISCRSTRENDDSRTIRIVDLNEFCSIVARRRCLVTSIADFSLWLPNANSKIFYDWIGIKLPNPDQMRLENYLAAFLLSEIESQVKTAEEVGKHIVIELSYWDAIAWGKLFPNSIFIPLECDLNILKQRLKRRREGGKSYDRGRILESILGTIFRSVHFEKLGFVQTPLVNNTMEDAYSNATLISYLSESIREFCSLGRTG